MDQPVTLPKLRNELFQLFGTMEAVREKLATIRHPDDPEDRLKSMAEQLDAIVDATETATNTILGASERIEELLDAIGQRSDNPEISSYLDKIAGHVADMYQACSFQDITGQWVGKAVTSLKTIDESVDRLISLWGKDRLAKAAVAEGPQGNDALLNGPQLGGATTSQEDIDKLFD